MQSRDDVSIFKWGYKKKSAQEWKPLKRPLVAGPGHDPGTS